MFIIAVFSRYYEQNHRILLHFNARRKTNKAMAKSYVWACQELVHIAI